MSSGQKGFRVPKDPTKNEIVESLGRQVEQLSKMNSTLVEKFMTLHNGVRTISESFDIKLDALAKIIKARQLMTDEEYTAALKEAQANLKVEKEKIQDEMDKVQNSKEPIKNGDIVVIDFEGSIEGKTFQGGKGVNYRFRMGTNSVIKELEDSLIGKSVNEEYETTASFPTNYFRQDLAGKAATFKVKVVQVKSKILETAEPKAE